MPSEPEPPISQDDAVSCTIRVAGALEPRWSDRLGGLLVDTRTIDGYATTELSGDLIDQAAVMGVLNSLYMLGLPLLTVDCATARRRRRGAEYGGWGGSVPDARRVLRPRRGHRRSGCDC